jgi:hypothetical protein
MVKHVRKNQRRHLLKNKASTEYSMRATEGMDEVRIIHPEKQKDKKEKKSF